MRTRLRALQAADPGWVGCALVFLMLAGFALSVDFPSAAHGFQSDESTYYSLAYSLALDGDFAFQRKDLVRVWEEFPTGPEGIFLKRGQEVDVQVAGRFPFVEVTKHPDRDTGRLYYGKSYIYPLVAAPFVRVFGTNGFLVLHAVLLTLDVAVGYAFLAARASPGAALAYAVIFLFGSAAPVYFVWLTPELLNLSLGFYGLFLWSYKLVTPADHAHAGRWRRFLLSERSDTFAAVVLGVATFSKPLNIALILPVAGWALYRRQWRRALSTGAAFAVTVVLLFSFNALVTGDFNYQGGDRNTFYGSTGFPFQTGEMRFESTGMERTTNRVPVEVLLNRDALLTVFPHNVVYFVLGRHTGLVPYFFPGVWCAILFLSARGRRQPWQWLVAATVVLAACGLLLYMPFTYSGGGGPVGNRYFMGFYPLLLFLTPPLASPASAVVAMAVGGLFTAQLVLNPFNASYYPAEHPKRGPYRLLPVELSLLNDLPMNVTPSRVRQPLGGDPRVLAYFLDDNAYSREGEWFWVRGESRAQLILRAPARARPDGTLESLRIRDLKVEIRSGQVPNRVRVEVAGRQRDVSMGPGEVAVVTLRPGRGFPYRPMPGHPANFVYLVSIESETGFVPLFTGGSRDSRFLGAYVRIEPFYDANP